jgi:hypothetical protein
LTNQRNVSSKPFFSAEMRVSENRWNYLPEDAYLKKWEKKIE